MRTRNKWCVATGIFLTLLIATLIGARLYLNVWLPRYVNNVLNHIPGYQGSIADIDIDLYRGAYRIHALKLYKKEGNIPTPFIDITAIDLSIQWKSLIHGRVVSDIQFEKPVINFAIDPSGTVKQTGKNIDWSQPIRQLMPIDINHVIFKDGSLTYQDFSTTPKVNVYIHHMSGEISNLRNVVEKEERLPSSVEVKGDSIGDGTLSIKGRMDILKEVPDMNLNIALEKVDLVALNDYSNAYARIDIKSGRLDIYSQLIVNNNEVSGYVKPIATDVSLIDVNKSANPVKLAWETVVSGVIKLFTNLPKNQFATKIPLEGHLDHVGTNDWAAFDGIIHNAFIRAFSKGFDQQLDATPH